MTGKQTDNSVMPTRLSASHRREQPHESPGKLGPLFDKTRQTTSLNIQTTQQTAKQLNKNDNPSRNE